MNEKIAVRSEDLASKVLAGEGEGEGFEHFRQEAASGFRGISEHPAQDDAQELLRVYTSRRISSQTAGAPTFGFKAALSQLASRGQELVLYSFFVGRANVFVIFAQPDGAPFACLGVARHEAPPIGEDGVPGRAAGGR